MKKLSGILLALVLVCLCAAALADVKIDQKNFPDDNFRAFIQDNYDSDKNGKLSNAEIATVTYMDCREKGIRDIKGMGSSLPS